VLLITLDTTRADQVGCYGGALARTPRLDALAAQGVRFEQATAAASSTLASHTSLFTGLYPRRHGVARNGFMVNDQNVTLAEVLGGAGFHTAGFIGSFALDQVFDFDQGFDVWNQDFEIEFDPERADQNQRRAEAVTDAVLAHLDRVGSEERLFLFAHYFDVHSPFDPPEPFASTYALPGGPLSSTLGDIREQELKHQSRIAAPRPVFDVGLDLGLAVGADGTRLPGDEALAALYAGELAYTDAQVGRLLDGLAERGLLQSCIVIVTADHGETFWEHGDFWHHGAWVYETNVHVPFIVHLPDGRGHGALVPEPVSGVDLFPTLLDLLGIALPEPVDGISLVEAINTGRAPLRPVFAEATQPSRVTEDQSRWVNQQKSKSIRRGPWKLIQTRYLAFEELYDLAHDPGERRNLLRQQEPAAETKAAYAELRVALDAWSAKEEPRDSQFNPEQMAAVLKRLRQLGYVGADEDEDD
jgi:arylsulfatase